MPILLPQLPYQQEGGGDEKQENCSSFAVAVRSSQDDPPLNDKLLFEYNGAVLYVNSCFIADGEPA